MIDILKCLLAILLLIYIFYIIGITCEKLIKLSERHPLERILIGFLLYFIAFQVICLPAILMQKRFSSMCGLWCILFFAAFLWSVQFLKQSHVCILPIEIKTISKKRILAVIFLALFFFATFSFMIFRASLGLDPAYYIGTMNEAVLTDRMYLFSGADGRGEYNILLRYAISGDFYMTFALLSKLLSVRPIMVAYYTMRGICYFLSGSIVYLIGRKILGKSFIVSLELSAVYIFCNLAWFSSYITDFFVTRGYEAKGYCLAVILPLGTYFLLLIFKELELNKNKRDSSSWKMLSILSLAAVPISMSSVFTLPALIGVGCIGIWAGSYKDISILIKGFICCIPNILYFIAYYLGTHGVYEIIIRW